ncbi:MAG TPA: rRNA maturation RNase YbeY [Gemmatimonadaceae bacterium]|nr:rRNA maturation RNase YbeY [Gemmatimonadaceae bacterium]
MSSVHVDVSFTVKRKEISERTVRDLVARTLKAERVRDGLISVAFVGEPTISKMNREFLSHAGSTDVISFGFRRTDNKSPVIGDIYICPQVARRNAREAGVAIKEELARLVVHGTLHVLGYDHPDADDRAKSKMWKRQERILDSAR